MYCIISVYIVCIFAYDWVTTYGKVSLIMKFNIFPICVWGDTMSILRYHRNRVQWHALYSIIHLQLTLMRAQPSAKPL